MLNKAQVIGYVGNDPKISTTKNNIKMAALSIATTEKGYTTKDGVTVPERTEWHNVVIFGRLAEVAEKYIKKGSRIYVEGKMRTRSYKDKNNVDRTVMEINVDSLEMLDSKNTSASSNSVQPQNQAPQTPPMSPNMSYFGSAAPSAPREENLPF